MPELLKGNFHKNPPSKATLTFESTFGSGKARAGSEYLVEEESKEGERGGGGGLAGQNKSGDENKSDNVCAVAKRTEEAQEHSP